MFPTWTPLLLKHLFRSRRRCGAECHARVFRPRLEALEDRTLLSTVTWDGGGGTSNWSDRFNWQGDIAPVAGDDLVFPAGAAQLSNSNNFASGTSFHSLTFRGSGYTISGGPSNVLNLGTGTNLNEISSGTNRYNGPIQLDGQRAFNVFSGSALELGGVLSGSGGILKTGGEGTLTLKGPGANTYTGLTEVRAGLLQLDKGPQGQTAIAIPGSSLNIISSSFGVGSPAANAEVRLLRDNQIADTATVTVTQGSSSFTPLLNLNGLLDTIGALNLTGGTVDTGSGGKLILNGDVTAQAAQTGIGTFTPASITGSSLFLRSTQKVTVNELPGSFLGLEVGANIVFGPTNGQVLIKEGAGLLSLNAAAVIGQVEVNAGTLAVNGDLRILYLILRNDALLSGSGGVHGEFFNLGGAVRTLDNSSTVGFTATGGWTPVTGQEGFSNNFIRAAPFGDSGTGSVASWDFTNLTPGLYRVFATWTSGSDRSTGARYSILDKTVSRGTFFVDQEQASTNGPRATDPQGVLRQFQQLGGAVNITSGTLRVQLSNKVDTERDGADVIADAVRIERLAGTLSPGSVGPNDVGTLVFTTSAVLGPGSTIRVDFVNTAPAVNSVDQIQAPSFTLADTLLVLSSSFFSPPPRGTAFRIITNEDSNLLNHGRFSNLPDNPDTIDLLAGGQRHTFRINYTAGDANDVDLIYLNTATQVRNLELSPDVINEGQRVTLRGALTDPNRGDVLSLRVNWGDGTVQNFTDLGTHPFHFAHTYADNSAPGAPFLVRVEWFDQHGAGNFRKLFVTVRNVPPRLLLGGAEVIRAGEVMYHSGRFTDPGADAPTATVDYGDGSGVQPLAIQPVQGLLFEHRYLRPGTYRVTVSVLDDDGGLGIDTFLVIVLPPL
ncbi:MAG: PKD domain-containing protein [Gemmataceae bacterium]